MKLLIKNSPLYTAIAVSVVGHAIILAIHFTMPDTSHSKPTNPEMDIVLVNAKHDKKPLKADMVAQANLEGGGEAETGHSQSPLPDMNKIEDGDNANATSRHIAELEAVQKQLLAQRNHAQFSTEPITETAKDEVQPTDGKDDLDSTQAIARQAAEINKRIEDQNKRPVRTHLSPNTLAAGYAAYYYALKDKIEKWGTSNFPQQDGKKIYGELTLSISIFQDGTLVKGEGDNGIVVDRPSGVPGLDEAAKQIVYKAAPFNKFPQSMRTAARDDIWIVTTHFKFTREDGFETDLRTVK